VACHIHLVIAIVTVAYRILALAFHITTEVVPKRADCIRMTVGFPYLRSPVVANRSYFVEAFEVIVVVEVMVVRQLEVEQILFASSSHSFGDLSKPCSH